MAKKIFIAAPFGSGAEDVQFAALLWAKKQGASIIRPIGKLGNFANMPKAFPENAPIGPTVDKTQEVLDVIDTEIFSVATQDYLVIPGWKSAYFLEGLFERYGDDSAFVLVRRTPDVAQSFAKKVYLSRNEDLIGIESEDDFQARVSIISQLVDNFAANHNLEWVKSAREIFDANLDVIPTTIPEKANRQVTILKGPNF